MEASAPLTDEEVPVAAAEGAHEEPVEPDNALGDEVIDFPKVNEASDFGDMYVAGKDAEQNSYSYKQPRASILYNAPDPFQVDPATYDAYTGDTHGFFKGQAGQALLARQG